MKFVRESGLLKIKPDARCMMANKTSKEILKDVLSAKNNTPPKEYEFWVSIPDDMEVPAPLIKKSFKGGLYAAYLMRNGIYEDSRVFAEWVNESEQYDFDIDDERPSFMELLNFYNHKPNYDESANEEAEQCDLLCPIKKIAE